MGRAARGGGHSSLFSGAALCYRARPMRITRQIRYAIYGVFDLAYNGEACPRRVHEIGERQRVPTRYLEQIFQRLRRAGLVDSKRGPGGGYTLARSPGDISVADILTARSHRSAI